MEAFAHRVVALLVLTSTIGCGDSVPIWDASAADGAAASNDGGPLDGSLACMGGGNTSGEAIACPGASSNPTLITLLPACALPDVPACTNARCVPVDLVPDSADPNDLADCGEGGKCVPDPFVATQGQFLLSRCTAAGGVEGRCLSPCVPEVAANSATLVQDVCQSGWLCSPCFDDHGAPTGACTQGCDPGPSEEAMCVPSDAGTGEPMDASVEPPVSCCGGLGLCLDTALVPAGSRDQLGRLECMGGELCVPTTLASGRPEPCRALGALRAEGRCLPACLPDVAAQADVLDRGTCDPDYLCAPCFDPRTGEATGACSNNGDTPTEPPKTFPACCEQAGRCVPPSSAGSDAASLSMRDCSSGLLCAPAGAVADPDTFAFPSCQIPAKTVTLFGLPITIRASAGACVPNCFMADRDQNLLALLELLFPSQGENPCDMGETCAPCVNPLDRMPTGACR